MRSRLVVLWAAVLPACSLLVDTGDLAGVPDGPAPIREAGVPDVTVDGSGAVDSGAPPVQDAETDSAQPRVCNATFCDDFDTPPLGAMWDSKTQSGGGSLTLGPGGLSPPNALVVNLTTTSTRRAFLRRRFAAVPTSLDCSVSVFVDIAPDSTSDVQFIGFGASGAGEPTVYLKIAGGAAGSGSVILEYHSAVGLPDGGARSRTDVVGTFLVGAWTRIQLKSDGNDAIVGLAGTTSMFPVVSGGSEPIDLLLGETGDGDNPTVRFFLDDLVCLVL